jgi:YidC/Oxa1 family membrane protein insertase
LEDREVRMLIAFALSFVVLLLWRFVLVKEPPKAPGRVGTEAISQPAPAPSTAEQEAKSPGASAPTGAAQALPLIEGAAPETIVVEGDLYRVTFSTEGGVVRSWVLKKYTGDHKEPLDVVNQPACGSLGYPLGLTLAMDPGLGRKLNSAVYVAKATRAQASESSGGDASQSSVPALGGTLNAPVNLEFVYSDGKVQVRKLFNFGSGYEAGVQVSVSDGQHNLPAAVTWPGGFGDHSLPGTQQVALEQAVYNGGNGIKTVAEKKLSVDQMLPGPLTFAGLEDRYFAGVFIPNSAADAFRIDKQPWTPLNWNNPKTTPNVVEGGLLNPEGKPLDFRLFVGPKDLDVLRAVQPSLDGLLDFGFFGVIAKPLFLCLRYIYDHWVANWGWAIVILTVLINMAMFPLKLKSIHSAQEMQRVQPIIKGIQDRYKQYKLNDPRKQKMNQEVMKIYQEHGINPLGGCLPMLLQMPILYAFWRMLDLPIELRHAPWILWVTDLSQPDTSHILGMSIPILPTLMILSMFVVQKMTPMPTADPQQKTMMLLMPLMMGFIFFRLASGLNLYYFVANLVGIAQQTIINRMMPPKPAPLATARAGAGKA